MNRVFLDVFKIRLNVLLYSVSTKEHDKVERCINALLIKDI